MTAIFPQGGNAAAQAVLDAAEEHYRRSITALNDIIRDVAEGNSARARDLKGALGDLNRAAHAAFEERNRLAKRIRSESGVAHDYALDIDDARAEIGRRLACLRAARGAGELPEGAE